MGTARERDKAKVSSQLVKPSRGGCHGKPNPPLLESKCCRGVTAQAGQRFAITGEALQALGAATPAVQANEEATDSHSAGPRFGDEHFQPHPLIEGHGRIRWRRLVE